jgi:hypothetical protein
VAPPPKTFDRNYTDDSLEVKNAKGKIVLQVKALVDRIQLQGEWWSDPVHGVRLIKSTDPKMPGAFMMIFGEKNRPGPPDIEPIFLYPSDLHFGELKPK